MFKSKTSFVEINRYSRPLRLIVGDAEMTAGYKDCVLLFVFDMSAYFIKTGSYCREGNASLLWLLKDRMRLLYHSGRLEGADSIPHKVN